MKLCNVLLVLSLGLAITLSAGSAFAVIANGDFGTGDFTGWTVSAIDDLGGPIDPSPFISVVSFGGGNAAQFETGEFAEGLFIGTLEQTFAISAAEPSAFFIWGLLGLTCAAGAWRRWKHA